MAVSVQLLAAVGCERYTPLPRQPTQWATCGRSVAHALGGIDSFVYTNSREAFEQNYRRGFRLFEADLRHTDDGALVLAHDWYTPHRQPAIARTSAQAFVRAGIYGRFTALTFADALAMLRQHPESWLLLDLKDDPEKTLQDLLTQATPQDSFALQHLIPIVYSPADFRDAAELRRFPSIVWSLHHTSASDEEVLKEVDRYGVGAVVLHQFRFNIHLAHLLRDRGVVVYVSTVNAVGQEAVFREWGASGVFTDVLPPDSACLSAVR